MSSAVKTRASGFLQNAPVTRLVLDRIVEGSTLRAFDPGHEKLLARAREDGSFPLIYQYLISRGRPVSQQFSAEWRDHIARLALYRAELRRVLAVVESISPVVVLKGEPLAELLYGDATLRNTTDMDLLVDPKHLNSLINALQEIDYKPDGSGKAKTWAYNQLLLRHERFGTLIELHWRIAFPHLPSPAIGELLATSVAAEGRAGGLSTRSLSPEMLFLQLCYHFQQHHGFLKGLLDVAGWIDRFEATANLDLIRREAKRLEINGVLQWPLHTLAIFTGFRSRLFDPDATIFARAWAAWTSAAFERDYIMLAPLSVPRRWPAQPGFAMKVLGTIVDAASMAVADGVLSRSRAMMSPVFLGPHRLGRAIFSGLESLDLVEREALFERRILAKTRA